MRRQHQQQHQPENLRFFDRKVVKPTSWSCMPFDLNLDIRPGPKQTRSYTYREVVRTNDEHGGGLIWAVWLRERADKNPRNGLDRYMHRAPMGSGGAK